MVAALRLPARPQQLLLTKTHLGLVLEYVPSGTLDRYCKRHPPDEHMARYLLRQMVVCVSFLHRMQVSAAPVSG